MKNRTDANEKSVFREEDTLKWSENLKALNKSYPFSLLAQSLLVRLQCGSHIIQRRNLYQALLVVA